MLPNIFLDAVSEGSSRLYNTVFIELFHSVERDFFQYPRTFFNSKHSSSVILLTDHGRLTEYLGKILTKGA